MIPRIESRMLPRSKFLSIKNAKYKINIEKGIIIILIFILNFIAFRYNSRISSLVLIFFLLHLILKIKAYIF